MKAVKSTTYFKGEDKFETFALKKNGNQRIVVKKNGKIVNFIKFRMQDGLILNTNN